MDPSLASRARARMFAQAGLVLGLVTIVGVCWALERAGLGGGGLGPAPALVLVGVPALLWLAYFYLQDRHEPEPGHLVLGVFLLGALVAAPIATWLVDDVYQVGEWVSLKRWSAAQIAGSFLVVAAAQELCKYLVVRYTIYLSDEFDEPMDGIVYATAAGIGFATALNFRQVSHGGLALAVGATHVVITTLAQACFSGVQGYAMGRARFMNDRGARTRVLAGGYLAAVALNGGFYLVEDLVTRRGLELQPWRGLALAALFAATVFAMLSLLVERHLARSPHRPLADGSGGTP